MNKRSSHHRVVSGQLHDAQTSTPRPRRSMEKLRKPFLTQPNQHVPTVAVNVGPINISTVAPQTSQHSTNVPTVRGKSINIQHQQLQTSQSTFSPVLTYISVACDTYWICCGVIYLICEPLLLRPPYERYRAQLEYTLTLCVFLHWAGLQQAPGEGIDD